MRKTIWTFIAVFVCVAGASANTGGVAWDKAPDRTNDLPALQNGARLFANYCLNCHSASFMRFNRLRDIGLSEQQIKDKLLFTTEKVGDNMRAAIDPLQAKLWFGANPPDLSVIARSRAVAGKGTGADYLYTYLRTFYSDASKVTGWNNLVFPNVGMPHALWELQGKRVPIYVTSQVHGHEVQTFEGWKQVTPGTMSEQEYDSAVADLVGYLQWMAEPAQNKRVRVGIWVLLFLCVLTFCTWRLNAAYWKDVK